MFSAVSVGVKAANYGAKAAKAAKTAKIAVTATKMAGGVANVATVATAAIAVAEEVSAMNEVQLSLSRHRLY